MAGLSETRVSGWDQAYEFVLINYRGAGQINHKPSYSIEAAADEILRGGQSWNGAGVQGRGAVATYSFPDWETGRKNVVGDFIDSPFNPQQQREAKLALQSWSDVANIKFTEVPSSQYSNITFGNVYAPDVQGYAIQPGTKDKFTGKKVFDYRGYDVSGQSWYDVSDGSNFAPEMGNYARLTLAHEIGHTLGLEHPGDYNGSEGDPSYIDATYAEDTRQFTIMSYWNEFITGADHGGYFASAPLLDDIAAIQKLYGANMSTRADDTTYGFNSNTERDFYTITSGAQKAIFSVWDGGGNDTLDFSGYHQDQRINLNEGNFSDIGGLRGNVSIATGAIIENAIGGSGNDIIIGNDADNIIEGGAGDDVIYGGAGQDQLWGGDGNNIFVFSNLNDSLYESPDIIEDFKSGEDLIDLSFFNEVNGDDKFIRFVEDFSGEAGESLLSYDAKAEISELAINVSGLTSSPDFLLQIAGQVNTDTDFIV